MTKPFRSAPTVHHGTIQGASTALPLTVRTSPRCWEYAVSFAPTGGADDDGALLGVRVTIAVAEGRIGVGYLTRDETAFLDEAVVDAGPAPVTIDVLGDRPGTTGPLMVRNASPDGASVATLIAVEAVAVAEHDDWSTPLSRPCIVPDWGRAYSTVGFDLAEKARLRRFDALTTPIDVRWGDDLCVRIVPDDQLSRAVYRSGTYEPHTLRVLQAALSPGDVFLDVGANAGVVSLAAAAWVGTTGRVIAVEPSAREFARLEAHLVLNRLAHVTAVRAAIAAEVGAGMLRVAAPPCAGMNTLGDRFPYEGVTAAGFEPVDTITLDALAGRERVARVHAMKLDVEGAEVAALRGATSILRDHRPVMVLEVCAAALAGAGSTVGDLDALLEAAGYACFEIDDTTGALHSVAALAADRDRNVAAAPVERAGALLDAMRRLDDN